MDFIETNDIKESIKLVRERFKKISEIEDLDFKWIDNILKEEFGNTLVLTDETGSKNG